jgi:hypothetical protein
METSEVVQVVVDVLTPYIGETMARSATEAHCRKLGFDDGNLPAEQLDQLLGKLAGGLNIFLGREKSRVVISEVRSALTNREVTR